MFIKLFRISKKIVITCVACLSVMLVSNQAFGGDFSSMDAEQISSITGTLQIVNIGIIIIAISLIVSSLFKLKHHGEMKGQGGYVQIKLTTPILMFFAGVALLFLPKIIPIIGSSIIGSGGVDSASDEVFRPLVLFLRAIGVVSVVRGILQLSKHTGDQQQGGVLGKAFVHIGGGLLLVHIEQVADIFSTSFGIAGIF